MGVKNVLVIYYSQTGQLSRIVHSFLSGFRSNEVAFTITEIKPKTPFPFPWHSDTFFGVMPDSVLLKGCAIKEPVIPGSRFDLIVLAYQPWFLSPSVPVTAALQHVKVQRHIAGKPVITIVGARNMWLNAHEKMKHILSSLKTYHVGNMVLIDRAPNLVSVITVMRWMFMGKKEATRWLPASGVSQQDIERMRDFGALTERFLLEDNLHLLQPEIIKKKGVEVNENLLFIEQRAAKIFVLWANFIEKRSNKIFWCRVFKWYLMFAVFIIAPVIVSFYSLFFKPFLLSKIQREKERYLNVS